MKFANKDNFVSLWERLGLLGDSSPAFFALQELYLEPHRHYHTLEHIDRSLRVLEESGYGNDVLEFAIWYHDAYYDTHRSDNEQRSADMAVEICIGSGIAKNVHDIIMTTAHIDNAETLEEQIMCDVDLSILGVCKKDYLVYKDQILKEYSWVLREIFAEKRIEILTSFLERDWIYHTDYFKTKYETKARENLLWAVDRLKNYSPKQVLHDVEVAL